VNQIGRTVVEAITDIERDVIPPLRQRKQSLPLPEWNPALSMVERLLVAGRRHESLCRALVHEQRESGGVEWSVLTRWVRKANRMADAFMLPPAQRPKRVWDLPVEQGQRAGT
jgi:hypothetical protein